MLLIPAIDLKEGRCVRLKQGLMEEATVFSDSPAETALHWFEQGARRLHLVDLNGAFAGVPQNLPAIKDILAAVAKDTGVSQGDAGKVLTSIVENIHKSLKDGGDVRISNLGVFDTADRAEREGRNPATGATIKIAASKAVRFRVSKPLKDAVNG